jgi:catechol 2,3-dioxygenase-like lactoylglutathione lyase family enzyme
MEMVVDRLLKDYEAGKMTRRQLIRGLAMASLAAAAPFGAASAQETAAAPGPSGYKTIGVDHISYQVADYKATRDFYASLMGMEVTDDNGTNQCFLHFGDHGAFMIPRNRRAPRGNPGGVSAGTSPAPPRGLVDHIAFKIEPWETDKVEAELKRRGLTPRLDTGGASGPPNWASFHVTDPDGFDLQIAGDVKPGDRLYKKT